MLFRSEGFGFTVLESMACGTPVVCSGETSLPEVAGDAALYANSRKPQEFAQAMHDAFTNASLRNTLIENGKKNIQRFGWGNAAKETLDVYRHAVQVSLRKTRAGLSGTPASPDKSIETN